MFKKKQMKHLKFLITFSILIFAISCGQQKKYALYKVKEGETIASIAKKLDMDTSDLLRLNPDVDKELKKNTEIFIPTNKRVQDTTQKDDIDDDTNVIIKKKVDTVKIVKPFEDISEKFILHKVKKGDTFYSLTRYYNVLKSDLLVLNPSLLEGLKLGATIKIKEKIEGEEVDEIYSDVIAENASVKIALLLPFRAKVFDTLTPQEIFKNRRLPNIVTDFYLGAELAIDSLRKQGVQVEMNVFDTEERNTVINDILSSNSLKEADVIIGPLYSEETEKVADRVNVPVIYPVFSASQSSFSKSKIVKTSPDKNLYKEVLLSYITEKYTNENIIIVGDSTTTSLLKIKQISNILKQHDSIHVVHEIVPNFGYIAQDRFLKILKPTTDNVVNWVIIASDDKIVAFDAVNNLISFPEPEIAKPGEVQKEKVNYTVKAFAFEKGDVFSMVDNNKLAQIGFTFVTDKFINESSLAARTFNKQYLSRNKALPSDDAARGFDVVYDVVMRLASGNDLNDTYKNGVSYRLEYKFDFTKKLFGPTENKGLFLLEYQPNLNLRRLK